MSETDELWKGVKITRDTIESLDWLLVDLQGPEWHKTRKGSPAIDALKKAHGDMFSAWINLTWSLMRDYDTAAFEIEPLIVRSGESATGWTRWEYDPTKNVAVSDTEKPEGRP